MKIPKLSQISFINKVRFSTQVFVVGVIFTATFFLLAIDVFKTYTSTVSVLVIPKSQVAAESRQQILGSVMEFPRTLSFYDRLLVLNPDVRDLAAGLSPNKRKMEWNKIISIKKSGGDSLVFDISITTARQSDSELLAGKTARTLFDVAARYYNIKTDLDLRIIDGPITVSHVPFQYLLFLISVLLGFGLAFILRLALMGNGGNSSADVDSHIEEEENLDIDGDGDKNQNLTQEIPKKKPWFDFSKFTNFSNLNQQGKEALEKLYQSDQVQMPGKPEEKCVDDVLLDENYLKAFEHDLKIKEMKRLTKQIEPDKYPNFPEMPIRTQSVSSEAKASAPDNLPIADASVLEMFGAPAPQNLPTQEEKPEIAEPQEPVIPKEPTPEELKKRLNELLRGKM